MIDAAAAIERDRRFVPFRRGPVVDAVRGAERLGARKLLVARRYDDRDDASSVRELQGEDRDAAGALQEHGAAGH